MATLRCSLNTTYFADDYYGVSDNDDGDVDDCLDEFYYDDDERNEETIKKMWLPKAVALCRYLWPSVKEDALSVDFLSHGSYNSIFSISIATAEDEKAEYVLRIPEFSMDTKYAVGILEHLNKFTDLKVPSVITWDATINNPLQNTYVILSRVPGTCLANVWKDLAHDQKLLLAKELAQLYHQIESVTNPVAGAMRVHDQDIRYRDELIDRTFVLAFGASTVESNCNRINWDTPKDGILPMRRDPPGLSVNDIMVAIFKRRIYDKKNSQLEDEFTLQWHEVCQRIIEDMVDMGLFDFQDNDVCLCHTDLFPRNIMVDFTPDITITGVLDWDDAMFVPKFAARVLPRWLWQSVPNEESKSESTSEYSYGVEPLDSRKTEPNSPQNAEIKLAFDSAVGERWVSEATGEWYTLARALIRFSRECVTSNSTFEHLAQWKEKWKSLSTDAVENLHFWTKKRNLSIFKEPGSLEYEVASDTSTRNDETVSCDRKDDEEMSCKNYSTIPWEDRTRVQFRKTLRWVLSMPVTPTHSGERHSREASSTTLTEVEELVLSSPGSLSKSILNIQYSATGMRTRDLPLSWISSKRLSVGSPRDNYFAIPDQGQRGIITTTKWFHETIP
ncbi:uncharacterized protein GGS22DRAFT_196765 [Annulohypoxylon maeteangense]|uniref:uncharacterized protein n=1 Tax=Annulohypoxylon maeteangense TaxID=1927788 RepID=UPI002008A438|nr:uncharacterized protein GGS22DRAFT_196765 [Annulohypoxylon maeteangense]KAI0889077.1 hypothetical protein GGS22DRAFT_196765 [Annulohypoxylon maeteangense]